MEETKVIYHIDDEDTPYLVKLPIAADKVTLADFKNVLNRPNYKFFFKSMDDDFGLVIRTLRKLDVGQCELRLTDGTQFSFVCSYWLHIVYIVAIAVHNPEVNCSITTIVFGPRLCEPFSVEILSTLIE